MENIINFTKRVFRGTQGTFLGLIVLTIFFSLASPYFFSARNFINILDQVTVLGIMALGMTAVIIIGGIDLSVGSILALSMMVTGWVWPIRWIRAVVWWYWAGVQGASRMSMLFDAVRVCP